MMNRFDAIENRIRDLFETTPSVFAGSDQSALLIHHLCESLQIYFSEVDTHAKSGNPSFLIKLNPVTLKQWKNQPNWETTLIEILKSTAAEFNLYFSAPPKFKIIARNSIAECEVIVSVVEPSTLKGETGAIPLRDNCGSSESSLGSTTKSFLILQGDQIIPLTRSVINIGRKSTNQIVINDLRISRIHAQIRRIQSEYVIFDVGSTGGTFVNSERINEHNLRQGDVISLAGYPIIYTQDQCLDDAKSKDETSEIKVKPKRENN